MAPCQLSCEREDEGFDASVGELDLDHTVGDRLGLADRLVHALVVRVAVTVNVDIDAVRSAERALNRTYTRTSAIAGCCVSAWG